MSGLYHPDFLLRTEAARRLYHKYAEGKPIIDYHCHLPVKEIAEDRRFDNLAQIWLGGDHYKWRAMRSCGVPERFITGDSSDWEKFLAWSRVFPKTIRHPLFHWTILELANPFGITDRYLGGDTAESIWNRCNELLAGDGFSARGLMTRMNVKVVCTTDDPADRLEAHRRLAEEYEKGLFGIRVLPTFRPDKALPLGAVTEDGARAYQAYLEKLGRTADRSIRSLDDLLDALAARHEAFHRLGGRLADHGFALFDFDENASFERAGSAFASLVGGKAISPEEARAISSIVLLRCARLHAQRRWTMQLHIGAIRDNSTRVYRAVGPDAGCDSILDGAYMRPLSRFLDRLDSEDALPKTIVYNLNPASNYPLASMIANFSRDFPGKMQYGAAWWFLDQFDGMRRQLETVSTMGLLSLFVGMLTDSRSFLSYTRHEYFRRILCDLLGREMEEGLLPNDFDWIGSIVEDIAHRNAENYFGF